MTDNAGKVKAALDAFEKCETAKAYMSLETKTLIRQALQSHGEMVEAFEHERAQFQRETLRASELSAMLCKILERLHETGCRAEEWPKKCRTCELMIEAETLLVKPLNDISTSKRGGS